MILFNLTSIQWISNKIKPAETKEEIKNGEIISDPGQTDTTDGSL